MLCALGAALFGCSGILNSGGDAGEAVAGHISWMEWPAQVQVDAPYQVRVVIPPLCDNGNLVVREVSNDSVLALSVRWDDVRRSEWGCEPAGPIYSISTRDVRGRSTARTLEVRGGGEAIDSMQRFGTLTAVTNTPVDSVLAAGYAVLLTETVCPRIVPGGRDPISAHYLLEGAPPELVHRAFLWVEGYITAAPQSQCNTTGQAIVFHLTSYR